MFGTINPPFFPYVPGNGGSTLSMQLPFFVPSLISIDMGHSRTILPVECPLAFPEGEPSVRFRGQRFGRLGFLCLALHNHQIG